MELGISAGCGINFSEFGRHLFFFFYCVYYCLDEPAKYRGKRTRQK